MGLMTPDVGVRGRRAGRDLFTVVLVLAAFLALTGVVSSTASVGRSTSCKLGSQARTLGPSYVTSLTVSATTCAAAKKLVRSYYRCRVAHGNVAGHCRQSVRGYRCSETRTGISIQFDATVRCRKGQARVVHTYTQNT